MTATGQNFEMYQGDDKILRVTVLDDDDNAVDITGTTIAWGIYRRTQGNIVLNKNTSSGISLTAPGSGIFEINLIRANTLSLQGRYLHEAEMTDLNGNHSTLFTGTVLIHKSLINT